MRAAYPRRFGVYVLIEALGDAPLDQMSLAFCGDAGAEILCVVQRLPRHLSENGELLARFREQTVLARRLSHGNLAATHAVGQIDREPFIAQEFVEGHDLSEVLALCATERVRFPIDLALYIVGQVARGLGYAHDFEGLELVHDEVGPSKIRLSYSGEVRLLGFGLAGSKHDGLTPPPVAPRPDRKQYRAPERQTGGGRYDRRADVYSLGVVLWELLTQRRFGADSPLAPSHLDPTLPAALDQVLTRALARQPEQRFQTADEMRNAIGECVPFTRNVEKALAELLGRLYDANAERARRRALVDAGASVRLRRSTGQNPLLPGKANGTRAGDDRTPPPLLSSAPAAAPEPPPAPPPAPVEERPVRRSYPSRAQRYRLRVVASAAFAVLTAATVVAVVVVLRYASVHATADAPLPLLGAEASRLPSAAAVEPPAAPHHETALGADASVAGH